jgi:periplasmic copper chaperone A
MKRLIGLLAIAAFFMVSCSANQNGSAKKNDISISDAWVRPAVLMEDGSGSSAAYMVIQNQGSSPDRLIKIETTQAGIAEIHETKMQDDVMSMSPVSGIDIPEKGFVELKQGSYHIMLMDLVDELKPGMSIPLTLTFEKAGTLTVDVPVRQP